MNVGRKPKDRYVPFYTLKWTNHPVPDPSIATEDTLLLPAIFTDREIAFKKGKPTTLLRFSAKVIEFKRLRDEEGNWAWAYPMKLPSQNPRTN